MKALILLKSKSNIYLIVFILVSGLAAFLILSMSKEKYADMDRILTSSVLDYNTRQSVSDKKNEIPPVSDKNNEIPPLKFEDFPVREIFSETPATVNLSSHPEAREWKELLKESAKEGPNFAGHYTIAQAGCGTECQIIWVIDAKNGNAYKAPFISEWGIKFDLKSNLLIENPQETIDEIGEKPIYISTKYYLWKDNKFIFAQSGDSGKFIDYPEWLGGY